MRDTEFLAIALNLIHPWFIETVKLEPERRRLNIRINFTKGAKFTCPQCGASEQVVHDTVPKTWRHLNFFQYETYITVRVPRIKCQCGVHLLDEPWAREGSGFTLLFEEMVMDMAPDMPVKTLGDKLSVTDTRLWRVIKHYTQRALAKLDLSRVSRVGVDETSSQRGHDYVTVFADLDTRDAIFVTEGKDAETVKRFKEFLLEHGGKVENIKQMCCDMSPAFIKGVNENFPQAELTFDKFHVVKVVNDAVDQVRREERKTSESLAKTRYLWLKSPENLTEKQKALLEELSLKECNKKTVRAWHLKLNFQEIFKRDRPIEEARILLKKWYYWATHSRLEPMKKAAATIKEHWDGVLEWFRSKISNGVLEGINSLVQAAKARARGYRNKSNFITMIYLIAGRLDFSEFFVAHL